VRRDGKHRPIVSDLMRSGLGVRRRCLPGPPGLQRTRRIRIPQRKIIELIVW
jgi:hypothetical protein